MLAADGKTVWSSGLLNPENVLGSPAQLTLDLYKLNVGPIEARTVQVRRTSDPDLSGSGGVGNVDEDNVLSLAEVEVYGCRIGLVRPISPHGSLRSHAE